MLFFYKHFQTEILQEQLLMEEIASQEWLETKKFTVLP